VVTDTLIGALIALLGEFSKKAGDYEGLTEKSQPLRNNFLALLREAEC